MRCLRCRETSVRRSQRRRQHGGCYSSWREFRPAERPGKPHDHPRLWVPSESAGCSRYDLHLSSAVPNCLTQVFTIHCAANGHYILWLFCLLVNKIADSYRTIFTEINEMSCNFSPKKMIVDFEVAIHNATQITWPSAQITGCRFHVAQNWCVYFFKVLG